MIAGMAARGTNLRRAAARAALGALIIAGTLAAAGAATDAPRPDPAERGPGFAAPTPAGVFEGVIEPLSPPARPALWENRAPVGPGDAQYEAALERAGAGAERAGQPVVVLDPGHGGSERGPHIHGAGVDEADSNLRFAKNLRLALRAAGVHVVLTREDEGLATLNFTGAPGRADLHARAEMAHLARADLFVSIHSNGGNEAARGLEVWYVSDDFDRFDEGENLAFAERMLESIGAELDAYGYAPRRSTMNGDCVDQEPGFCDPLYVPSPFILLDASVAREWGRGPAELGLSEDRFAPAPPMGEHVPHVGEHVPHTVHKYHGPIDLTDPATQTGPAAVMRGTLMPTVLVELLYMTNWREAQVLQDEAARAAMVRGMAAAILGELREMGALPAAEPSLGLIDYREPELRRFLSLR